MKTFKVIGICLLTIFSFYYTNKIIDFSKSKDPIMKKIIKESENLNIPATDAQVFNNYIIPGESGSKIDIDKSYERMKKVGSYNENLLVFINDYPKISINNNLNKYIIQGNENKEAISIVFNLNNSKYVDKLMQILKENKIETTFFIDGKWGVENKDILKLITESNHKIGNKGYDNRYKKSDIAKTNNLIKSITKTNNKFCLTTTINDELLLSCKNKNMYTIKPKIINFNTEITLKKGDIYLLEINSKTIEHIEIFINYIKQKGYEIINLDKMIEEK